MKYIGEETEGERGTRVTAKSRALGVVHRLRNALRGRGMGRRGGKF